MARRTHEQIVEEYAKEYDRIRKQISRMRQRGYTVDGIQPARVPKKDIKARDLEKLKKLTNEKIYEKSSFEGFSGEFMKKAEQHERAKKSAATRKRKQEQKKPGIDFIPEPPAAPEAPTPPAAPPAPPEEPPTPPGPEGLTDEEESALDRLNDIIRQYKEEIRKQMESWEANMIRRIGRKKFAGMIVDALDDGFIIEWVPPSQQPGNGMLIMDTINSYMPDDISEEDREESEEEWDDILDAIEDDEDYLPFD